MKKTSLFTLIFLCCLWVQAIEMSDYEKKLFEENLTSQINGNKSGFQIWPSFFYSDDSEFRKPSDRYTGGWGSGGHDYETQGILHIHDYDENGDLVIEK